jgi:DNA-binding PadR family transcriptional regulator
MSAVRLLVLGIVRMHGRTHGYAVHRELTQWKSDTWTSVKPGSVYHALKQLAKEGKLREVGAEDSSEGPERMLYALSPAGEKEFQQRLHAAFASFDPQQLGAGIAFMQSLPRERAIERLRTLHTRADENRRHLDALAPHFADRTAPPHTADLLELWSGGLQATAAWAQRLLARLESGDYVMAGESAATKYSPAPTRTTTAAADAPKRRGRDSRRR